MYQTNTAYDTKLTQQSVGTVPSLVNLTDGHMSVLALNAGPKISICCVVFMPGPSAYQLHSHYHYHHPSLLLLVLFPYQLPWSVCCPTVSTTYNLCVPKGNSHLVTCPSASPHVQPRLCDKNRCCDHHVAVLTAVTDYGPPKPRRPEIICMAWSWESQ